MAMGASAFQPMPNGRIQTLLHASAPMNGPGVPPPAVSFLVEFPRCNFGFSLRVFSSHYVAIVHSKKRAQLLVLP